MQGGAPPSPIFKTERKMKNAIMVILEGEKDLDAKLSMLTEIGLTTSNDETYQLTEEIRHELVETEEMFK